MSILWIWFHTEINRALNYQKEALIFASAEKKHVAIPHVDTRGRHCTVESPETHKAPLEFSLRLTQTRFHTGSLI